MKDGVGVKAVQSPHRGLRPNGGCEHVADRQAANANMIRRQFPQEASQPPRGHMFLDRDEPACVPKRGKGCGSGGREERYGEHRARDAGTMEATGCFEGHACDGTCGDDGQISHRSREFHGCEPRDRNGMQRRLSSFAEP